MDNYQFFKQNANNMKIISNHQNRKLMNINKKLTSQN